MIDLGAEWREVDYTEWRSAKCPPHGDQAYIRVGTKEQFYFRVPKLPTKRHTFIKCGWDSGERGYYMLGLDGWRNVDSGDLVVNPERMATDFTVIFTPSDE